MAQPVVHFEIIGKEPAKLRTFYGELFGWTFDTSGPVSPAVSQAGNYGFTESSKGDGVPGGVGGGAAYAPHVIFYIDVPDIEAALRKAEQLGGKRVLGPEHSPSTPLVIGHFTDPEGNLIGLASTG